jgi:hypothetical protein
MKKSYIILFILAAFFLLKNLYAQAKVLSSGIFLCGDWEDSKQVLKCIVFWGNQNWVVVGCCNQPQYQSIKTYSREDF